MSGLARRAVACRGWRWLAGMIDDEYGYRMLSDGVWCIPALCEVTFNPDDSWQPVLGDLLPDLSDPATLGCLLALVREAYPVDSITYSLGDLEVLAVFPVDAREYRFESLESGGSLVAALEAAP